MYFIGLLLQEFHIKEIFDFSVRFKDHTILSCSVSMDTEQCGEGHKERANIQQYFLNLLFHFPKKFD